MLGAESDSWFKGNTHAHTTLSNHADSSPEQVAAWYHDHGYHFLILSEHNIFIDPKTVKLPTHKRKDFILIPGVEITGRVHTTGMNVNKVVPWKSSWMFKSSMIQSHVDGAIKAGGQAILNHPNFHYTLKAKDISPVKKLHMFELFNGHPHVNSAGDYRHDSTEKMWDDLLAMGMLIYGVSSDDAHDFQTIDKNKSNPGRGWVMVKAAKLNPSAITNAMLQGDFYASNGVFLRIYMRGPDRYVIEVDTEKTEQELMSAPELRGQHIHYGSQGYRIEFIGPDGKVLKSINDNKGSFKISGSISTIRAKVIYTRLQPQTNYLEEYYAWGQPFFTDERGSTASLKN